jgi:hypothetical protein
MEPVGRERIFFALGDLIVPLLKCFRIDRQSGVP